jgi:hypothetical protein
VLKHDGKRREDTWPCVFGGDLNEAYWPRRILKAAGFADCFGALGLAGSSTHPWRPSIPEEDELADGALDWLFHNGERHGGIRPTLAAVIKPVAGSTASAFSACAASDHYPVMCHYVVE